MRGGRCDSLNGLGKAHLGPVQRGQVEPGFPLDLFTNNCLFGHRGPYRLLDDDLVDLDQLGGVVNDARLREANVPLAGKLLKRVADGGPCPVRAVAVDSQLRGQFVGRLEADPSNVVGQAVGVLLDFGNGFLAVGAVDAAQPGPKLMPCSARKSMILRTSFCSSQLWRICLTRSLPSPLM